jgi:hypothetical protein
MSVSVVQRRGKMEFSTVVLFAGILFLLGIAVKIFWYHHSINLEANQAAWDAYYYHVPQINEFIAHGFRGHYQNFVAMTPGLHMLYAAIGIALGVKEFAYDSSLLFAIHSVWMVAYIGLNLAIIHKMYQRNDTALVMVLPLLASSYPIYSWVWPTTDLPATDLYLAAIVIEFHAWRPAWRSQAARLAIYAVLGAVGVMIRQHYGFLAAIPAGILIAEFLVRRERRLDPMRLLVYLSPVLPALAVLGYFIALWGGPVPPDQAFHYAPFGAPIALAHVLGFTGLIGFPFAVSLWRLLRENRIRPVWILISAIAVGLAAAAFLPLEPNVAAGRFGSLLWTIEGRIPFLAGRFVFLAGAIGFGAAIWLAVAALCVRRQQAIPTVVLFAMYTGTLLVQEYCFQRYVEEPILLTLAVFILWQARLPRAETGLWGICFGAYMIVSWAKLFVGFGGWGPHTIEPTPKS